MSERPDNYWKHFRVGFLAVDPEGQPVDVEAAIAAAGGFQAWAAARKELKAKILARFDESLVPLLPTNTDMEVNPITGTIILMCEEAVLVEGIRRQLQAVLDDEFPGHKVVVKRPQGVVAMLPAAEALEEKKEVG